MEKYESKQQKIHRRAEDIYAVLSDFNNFTPILADKVEEWNAEENSCTFKVKGIKVRLLIVDKEPFSFIKLGGDELSPVEFNLWIQLKEVESYDTRLRLVLHANLNIMMRMMIGGKLQQGLDQMAEQIALVFNQTHSPQPQSNYVAQQ